MKPAAFVIRILVKILAVIIEEFCCHLPQLLEFQLENNNDKMQ